MKVGLVQLEIADGAPQENLARATDLVARAPEADLYVLPELWSTGYAHALWAQSAEADTPAIIEALTRLARDRKAAIAGSLISRHAAGGGDLVNRLWLVHPDGRTATYDKGHLFAPMLEDRHLVAGSSRSRTTIGGWQAALSICYDLRFPEQYRLDALDGAELFVVVSEWPAERAATLRTLACARAMENQAYLVLCNRTGIAGDGTTFGGGSCVVAPDGCVTLDLGMEAGVGVATLDHAVLKRTRERLPLLTQRRAGLDWSV